MAYARALAVFRVLVGLAELQGLPDGETGFGMLGEPAVIGQEPPDDACQATGNNHQGVRVLLAHGAVFAVNAFEVLMAVTGNRRGIPHRMAMSQYLLEGGSRC